MCLDVLVFGEVVGHGESFEGVGELVEQGGESVVVFIVPCLGGDSDVSEGGRHLDCPGGGLYGAGVPRSHVPLVRGGQHVHRRGVRARLYQIMMISTK